LNVHDAKIPLVGDLFDVIVFCALVNRKRWRSRNRLLTS